MNIEALLTERTKAMSASAIREILKLVNKPGMVSLAGGIPAPESFPMDIMPELVKRVFDKYSSYALQYDITEGFLPLREELAKYLATQHLTCTADEINITSGSQGLLDALGKVFIEPGDLIAVEAPTYLGALQAFNPYQPGYVSIMTDEDGVVPEELEKILRKTKIKFIYLIPSFQNPSGRTTTLERRKKIAEIIKTHGALIVEDDPYSRLRYRGQELPPIKSFAPDNVIYMSTFSKIFAPGLRIGFSIAPREASAALVKVKQGIDLHTSTFNQALASEYLSGGYLDKQLPKIVSIYAPKQKAMLDALERYFPEGYKWSKPEGGMFIWLEGPAGMDAVAYYKKAVENNVAYVPGRFFFTEPGAGLATMRLNFTMSSADVLSGAIKTLSEVFKKGL